MFWLDDEMRLLYAVLINTAVIACAYRFIARRGSDDKVQRLADMGLLYFLIQYASVGLCGLLHCLSPVPLFLVAGAICAALWVGAGARKAAAITIPGPVRERRIWRVGLIIALGFLTAVVYLQRSLPVLAEDAMTYHLPAAVQWLATGRIGLFPTWFFNPANTYSPLAGSTFAAWLIAPMGNDVLVRFVQVPALLLVFLLMIRLCRSMGATPLVALFIAAATMLCRSFISEAMEPKDDLFLSAFFLAVVVGCSKERLKDPFGPWRVGVALGLLLATKYTALYALPMLLLLADAPVRAGWKLRQWVIAIALTIVLAGPWYLRNLIVDANPLYPLDVHFQGLHIFHGLFHTRRSLDLRTPAGVWRVFTARYHSVPLLLWGLLAAGWIGAWAAVWGNVRDRFVRDSLTRICVCGPVIGIGLFLLTAPYPEIRFVFPSLLLLFACIALSLTRWLGSASRVKFAGSAAVIVAICAALTSFAPNIMPSILAYAVPIAAVGLAVCALAGWKPLRAWFTGDRRWLAGLVGIFIIGAAVYVDWKAYVVEYRNDLIPWGWKFYPRMANAWGFVRDHVPPGDSIAYANTHLVYPLLGFNYDHQVFYVPTRPGIDRLSDLPPLTAGVSGEQMIPAFTALLWQDPDGALWLQRLKRSGAKILFVVKRTADEDRDPPELSFAEHDSAHFHRVFDDDAAAIYEIEW